MYSDSFFLFMKQKKTTEINKVRLSSSKETKNRCQKGGVRMIQFRLKGSIDYVQVSEKHNQKSKTASLKIKFRKKS